MGSVGARRLTGGFALALGFFFFGLAGAQAGTLLFAPLRLAALRLAAAVCLAVQRAFFALAFRLRFAFALTAIDPRR